MNVPQKPISKSNQTQLTLRDLLAKLDNLNYMQMDPELQLIELKEGEVLFEEGDEGHSMYIVLAGVLGVRMKQSDGTDSVIDKLAPGATVGELALLSGQPRSATVFAVNDAGLIRLSQSKFEQLTKEDQRQFVDMDTTVVARWQRLQLAVILRDLLGELDTSELHQMQSRLEWHHFSNGDVLFRQGDEADGMYVVINGRLRATIIPPQGEPEVIGEIGTGETIGEFALLTDEPRAATVFAVRETNAVKMTKSVFQQLTRERPEWMGAIARIIVQRQQRTFKQIKSISPTTLNIALIPASPSVDIGKFAQELSAAMSRYGTVLALDSQQFDERYGQPNASQTKPDAPENTIITAWISKVEADHSYLLFAADHSTSPWTQRCLNQADRVLIIADPQENPTPGAAEQALTQLEVPVHIELVLWHPSETKRPLGTAAWLDVYQIQAHHHVRQGDTAHINRLARRLTGHAFGLVLSGGAARGFAQIGVQRAMEELGIPIDYIGGTSMGAVMGGYMQISDKNDELMQMAPRFARPKVLFDRTLPFTAINASKKVTQFTKDSFGDMQIEDLWIPFFCVASNLTTAEPVVFERGPLWKAIRASLAIPGVFTPVVHDGDLLVDGGIMDNFPIKLMAERCKSDRIIGVNVNPLRVKKRTYDFETSISGWRILFSRLNPFTKPLRTPSLIGTVVRAMDVNSKYQINEQTPLLSIIITPDVRKFPVTHYHKFAAIAQAGYEAALDPLREWKEMNFTS